MLRRFFMLAMIAAAAFSCFALADAAAVPDEVADRFSDTWVADGYSAEIWVDEGVFLCDTALKDDSFCEYRSCVWDAATDTLICSDGTRFFASYDEETLDYVHDDIATGLTAVFSEKDGRLTCEDSEGLLDGVVFLSLDEAEEIDAAAEFDPYLIGEWESPDGMSVLTIEKNPGGVHWDAEAVIARTHGALVFKATLRYDGERDCFVYDKGKFWDVPITDTGELPDLGEAKVAGAAGSFALTGDDSDLMLRWADDGNPDQETLFRRAGASS